MLEMMGFVKYGKVLAFHTSLSIREVSCELEDLAQDEIRRDSFVSVAASVVQPDLLRDRDVRAGVAGDCCHMRSVRNSVPITTL